MEDEDGPPVCEWCECELVEGDGFVFESERDDETGARSGFYCSVSCWISAS